MPSMTKHFLCFLLVAGACAQPPQPNAPEFLREGQKLVRAGQLEEALALYQREIGKDPSSTAALNAAGVVLDLLGRTAEARQYFQKSAEAARDEQARAVAWRQMAMSYAFDNDCANSARYGRMLIDYWLKRGNHPAAKLSNQLFFVVHRCDDRKGWLLFYHTASTPSMVMALRCVVLMITNLDGFMLRRSTVQYLRQTYRDSRVALRY
jgi:tetratricopeptide (TPR) repeat protein